MIVIDMIVLDALSNKKIYIDYLNNINTGPRIYDMKIFFYNEIYTLAINREDCFPSSFDLYVYNTKMSIFDKHIIELINSYKLEKIIEGLNLLVQNGNS